MTGAELSAFWEWRDALAALQRADYALDIARKCHPRSAKETDAAEKRSAARARVIIKAGVLEVAARDALAREAREVRRKAVGA